MYHVRIEFILVELLKLGHAHAASFPPSVERPQASSRRNFGVASHCSAAQLLKYPQRPALPRCHCATVCSSGQLAEAEQAGGLETAMQAAAIAAPPRLDVISAPAPVSLVVE